MPEIEKADFLLSKTGFILLLVEAVPQTIVELAEYNVKDHFNYFCCMYSKQEASQLRKDFWTSFGQYMSPVLSAEGEKISWLNYKTGEKNIFFRMHADNKNAVIAIELAHTDMDIQQIYFEQFQQLKKIFETTMNEEWNWVLHATDDNGKTVSRIFFELSDVSVFKREDWPRLISFFKPRIVALDEFWSNVKYSFEALR